VSMKCTDVACDLEATMMVFDSAHGDTPFCDDHGKAWAGLLAHLGSKVKITRL